MLHVHMLLSLTSSPSSSPRYTESPLPFPTRCPATLDCYGENSVRTENGPVRECSLLQLLSLMFVITQEKYLNSKFLFLIYVFFFIECEQNFEMFLLAESLRQSETIRLMTGNDFRTQSFCLSKLPGRRNRVSTGSSS